jgi:tetraacyldisaccharide 4'-kinase
MNGGKRYYLDLVDGRRRTVADRCLLALLRVLSVPYAMVMRARAAGYRCGILRSRTLPAPVISVGNLTTGGTGKTPTVAWLARYLLERGRRVAVLSRGYGGSAEGQIRIVSDGTRLLCTPDEAGDEPCLLAQSVPGLMVVTGADRYAAGLFALERLAPDLFILDDGFQHQRLRRDLDILLMDCHRPFGNGWTLPAGLLREPASAAGRADIVVSTRCNGDAARPAIPDGTPWCATAHRLTGLVPLEGGAREPFAALAGMPVVAFAGIADPDGFFADLEREGLTLAAAMAFPDHVAYGAAELAEICRVRDGAGASCLVTTAKDGIKLATRAAALGDCRISLMELAFADPLPLAAAVEAVLRKDERDRAGSRQRDRDEL